MKQTLLHKKNYPTNKVVYKYINEIWSIDLADVSDYKIPNKKGYRYILNIIDIFSKKLWAIPFKNRNNKTKTDQFSIILTK